MSNIHIQMRADYYAMIEGGCPNCHTYLIAIEPTYIGLTRELTSTKCYKCNREVPLKTPPQFVYIEPTKEEEVLLQ